MTVTSTKITAGPYAGNGVSNTFSYGFGINDKSEIKVFETDALGNQLTLLVDTDYTVNGVGVETGGTVTRLAGALPSNYSWYMRSNYIETQETEFESQGSFYPDIHEKAFDKSVRLVQQVQDKVDRSLKFSESYDGDADPTMPDPQSDKIFGWDDQALNIVNRIIPNEVINITGDTVVQVNTLAALKALDADFVGQIVNLLGHTETGLGGDRSGMFYWATTAEIPNLVNFVTFDPLKGVYVPPNSDITGASGAWVRQNVTYLSPEFFGATGNNPSNDDSISIQAMFDFIYNAMPNYIGAVEFGQGKKYYCGNGADIIIDTGFTNIQGNGSELLFTKTCSDPLLEPEIVTNFSFSPDGTGWSGFSDIGYIDYTFDGSNAVHTTASGEYGGTYQTVTLEQGEWYTIRTLINSITNSAGQQYLFIGIRDGGPDGGGAEGQTYGPSDAGTEKTHTFKWTQATGTYWLSMKSNNPVSVAYTSLKIAPQNKCIQLTGDYSPHAQQYSPILGTATIENLTVKAQGTASNFGIGMFSNTDTAAFRTQYTLRNVSIRDFDVNLETANRTYICVWDGGSCTGAGTAGVIFGTGDDAGENMRLLNVTFGNGQGLINNGRLVHIDHCSFDYTTGAFIEQTGGYVHITQTHMEKNHPVSATDYVINIDGGGTMIIDQGYMQVNTPGGPNVVDYMFNVSGDSRLIINNMQAFGLITTTDEIWTGDGRADIRFSGIPQKTVARFSNKNYSLVPLSAGSTTDGENWPLYVSGGARTDYKTTANAAASILAGTGPSGENMVSVEKLVGSGIDASVNILVPIPTTGMFSSECFINIRNASNPAGSFDLFIDWYQTHSTMRPDGVWAVENLSWLGEFNSLRNVDLTSGSTGFTQISQSSVHNTNTSTAGDEFGFDARTHCVLTLNMVSFPINTIFEIEGMIATVI